MTVTKAQLETQLAELQDQLTRAEEQLVASDNPGNQATGCRPGAKPACRA